MNRFFKRTLTGICIVPESVLLVSSMKLNHIAPASASQTEHDRTSNAKLVLHIESRLLYSIEIVPDCVNFLMKTSNQNQFHQSRVVSEYCSSDHSGRSILWPLKSRLNGKLSLLFLI